MEFIRRDIYNLSKLCCWPHIIIRVPSPNIYNEKESEVFILYLHTNFFSSFTKTTNHSEKTGKKRKKKKKMRSSIFLVVPFAAVALGQVVRFSTPSFPPLQALFPKYIIRCPLPPEFIDGSKLTFVFSLVQLARRRH